MATINQKSPVGSFIKALKIIFGIIFGLPFGLATLYSAYQNILIIERMVGNGVFPVRFIMKNICVTCIMLCFFVAVIKPVFSEKLSNLPYVNIGLCMGVFVLGGAVFSIVDTYDKINFRYADYPGYIETWPRKIIYKTKECIYPDESSPYKIKMSSYMTFLQEGFRNSVQVSVVEDAKLTDSFRIEISYKGEDAELSVYSSSDYYSSEDIANGISSDQEYHISLWEKNYDDDLTPQDYAYMYKNKVELEYCSKIAVEKVVIYTAYPDKIDVSDISEY